MVSDKFRQELRREADLWQAEGLIDATLHQKLADRYQWQTLETAAGDRFVMILLGVGGVLLALAAITFVAANWQLWSRTFKLTLLLAVFLGTNITGFYLWRRPKLRQKRLGHGLLLLGALLLGANLALMAQMFHLSGESYELFVIWGLGVLVMAYSLPLASLGVCSVILVGIGYLSSTWDNTIWVEGGEFSWLRSLLLYMPLLVGPLWLPLAYRCRSRIIFALMTLLWVGAVERTLTLEIVPTPTYQGWLLALAFGLPPALLWGYDDLIWPRVTQRLFQPLAHTLALVFLSLLFYSFSFHWSWPEPIRPESVGFGWQSHSESNSLHAVIWLNMMMLSGFTGVCWLYRQHFARQHRPAFRFDSTTKVIAGLIAIATVIPYWHYSIQPMQALATFIFNVLLFLLAIGLIREGLEQVNRRNFWYGIVLLVLQILSRMLEYNTALLFKSFVFLLCGIGVVAAGLWFERYRTRLHQLKQEHTS